MVEVLSWLFFGLTKFMESSWSKWAFVLLSPLIGFFTVIVKLLDKLNTYLNEMMTMSIEAMGDPGSFNGGTAIGMINSIIPLDTIFGYLLLAIEIYTVAIIYRAVKSFIPTLS